MQEEHAYFRIISSPSIKTAFYQNSRVSVHSTQFVSEAFNIISFCMFWGRISLRNTLVIYTLLIILLVSK